MTRTSIEIERLAPPILLGLVDVITVDPTQQQPKEEWQDFYRDEFGVEPVGLTDIAAVDLTQQQPKEEWQDFYRSEFGIELDLSTLVIPESREGFDRLLIIAEGMTINRVYDQCGKYFKMRKGTDDNLDDAIHTNDRDPKNGTYAIWVRDTVEADEQSKNKSANNLKSEQYIGITFLERLIYELKYFKETGDHLDIHHATLCSGSHGSDGLVLYILWLSNIYVLWCDPDFCLPGLRSREVVS
jgi:hypothetical protein